MKTYTIRQILLLLVSSLVFPACLIAIGFSVKAYVDGRDNVNLSTLQTARAMTLVVERELGALQSTTQALAYSSHLKTGNFAAFHAQAQDVLRNTSGFNLLLSDSSGQQLVNTLKPFGSVLPLHGNPAMLARVFATGKPVISDLFIGPLAEKPVIGIGVPVVVDGKVRYELSIGLWPDQFAKILASQNIPQDWIISIFDSGGTIVARNKAAEQFVGKKGASGLLQAMEVSPEGIKEIKTLEGIPVHVMYSRAAATGWSVAIGIPTSTVSAGLWRSLWLTTGVTAALLMVGLWAASLAGRRITRSFQLLIPQATALGLGHPVKIPEVAITEALSVSSAIAKAADLLKISETNRHDAEEALRIANEELERRVEARTAELTDAVQQLDVARIAADSASAAKSSFVANMSHEIRTPMNAVLGLLQLTQMTALDARQRDYVGKAQSAAKSLLGLLNDILDFSKMDVGKLELDIHSFELEELMRDLAIVLSGAQGEADVEVIFEIDPALPRVLRGDRLRFQQILINLAGNSVKFTQAGQVVIRLTKQARGAGDLTLGVEVIDTGIGMSSEQLTRVFDGFTQAETSTTRRFGGTGLGLVISQRLVALMGGNLMVESALGLGSRFWFDITLAVDNTTRVTPVSTSLPKALRVLVVDDNPLSCEILVQTLEHVGWRANSASDGAAGVDCVQLAHTQAIPYDVVLMDWRMPGIDGLTAASLIKQTLPSGQLPVIIMVTAFGREVLAEAAQLPEAPFVDFLTKPVTPQQLVTAVQKALVSTVPQDATLTASFVPKLRLKGARILLVEDNAVNRQVASELLQAEGAEVSLAEGGLQGVSMAAQAGSPYDAVIMDVQMPDVDGFEATRRIRVSEHGRRLPILAMTANASAANREECLAAGMDDHIAKPIDIDEVVARLLKLLSSKMVVDLSQHITANLKSDALVEPLQVILKRFGQHDDIYRMTLSGFKPESLRLVAELRNHLHGADLARAAATMHSMKGVAATVGASSLAKLAAELEYRAKTDKDIAPQVLFSNGVLASLIELVEMSNAALAAAILPSPP